jgi:hypothetical protein
MSRRTLRRIVPFVVLTVVFAALLYRAEHKAETGISRVDRHITEVTSPCLRYGPSSRQCKRSFEAAVATIDHAEACAVLRKAGLRVESCRGARLAQEQRQHVQEATSSQAENEPPPDGGDANSAPTGSSQPAPGNGGRGEQGPGGSHIGGVPGEGGSHGAPAPDNGGSGGPSVPPAATPSAPPSASSSQSSSSSTTERTTESTVVESAPEAVAPVRDGIGAVVESVGGVVEETGASVNEVVGGVQETTCQLAKVLCHE